MTAESADLGVESIHFSNKSVKTYLKHLMWRESSCIRTVGIPLFIWVFTFIGAISQKSDYILTQFTVNDGLPSNECYAVIQDSRGYVWVSTDNGVARFDGYEFKTYGLDEGLGDLVIFRMIEDVDGRIWMGGMFQKMYIYDPACDRFELYIYQSLLDKYFDKRNVYKEFHVHQDTLWIVGESMTRIDPNGEVKQSGNDKFKGFRLYKSDHFVLNSRFRPSNEEMISIMKNPTMNIYSNDNTYNLKIDIKKNDRILSHSFASAYISTDNGHNEAIYSIGEHIGIIDKNNRLIFKKSEKDVIYLSQDKKKRIVMGLSNGKGIRLYRDFRKNDFETIIGDIEGSGFLEDNAGSYWITSLDKGLFYIKSPKTKYACSSCKEDYFSHVDSDSLGNIYLASFKGGIYKISFFQNSEITTIFHPTGRQVKTFRIIDNILWFQNEIFMLVYNLVDNKISIVKNPFNTFDNRYLNTSDILKHNQFYLALGDKTELYKIKNNNNFYYTEEIIKINHNNYEKNYSIISDSNFIYTATSHGLYIFDTKTHNSVKSDQIPEIRIEKIVQDNSGHKYLATKGKGLIVWPRDSHPYYITEKQGLLSNILEDVSLGDHNQVWVASIEGITQIIFDSLGQYRIKNYTPAHGLPSPDVYHTVWTNGKLFAATGQGILEIQPLNIDSTVYTPVLTSVSVNNQQIAIESPFVFNHKENNIKIEFESIDFFQGRNTQFQYTINEGPPIKLQQRYINLTDLLPGDYRIEISSVNHDNIISQPAVFQMKINKPWYQTYIFIFLLFLTLLVVTFVIVRARINFLKEKNDIANEILNLEKAALQAQMNPHFIFNCLNSIQSFIVKNDKEKAMEYLGSFAHLIRQYLNSSTQKYISLSEEINLLTNYINLESLRFNNSFNYNIILEQGIHTSEISIPPMMLQPFVENAIIHGMKEKKDKDGLITIHFKLEKSNLYVKISDNGNGVQIHEKEQNKHKSMGTSITQRRIQHIMKSKNPEFNFNIESNPTGTIVHLRVPYIAHH